MKMARYLISLALGAVVLVVGGGAVSAATTARPVNQSPPTVSGNAAVGSVLQGTLGTWSGNPTDFNTWWQRCNGKGGSCQNIQGTGGQRSYRLVDADAGHRVRFDVGARNADGRTWAASVPTAVVTGAAPVNTKLPTVSGNPVIGATLTGGRGSWSGNPTDFNTWWQRCDSHGANCANISGTGGHAKYKIGSADAGMTLRYAVGAANKEGRTWAYSAPTAVIGVARPGGCSNPSNVSGITSPARLVLDGMQSPSVVTRQTSTLILRFHVSSTCGGNVAGALVYVTAVPYEQFSIPSEKASGSDGWVEVQLQRMSGFPISSRQQLIALFVRARKPGENLLAGISTRRLFSVRVNLHA